MKNNYKAAVVLLLTLFVNLAVYSVVQKYGHSSSSPAKTERWGEMYRPKQNGNEAATKRGLLLREEQESSSPANERRLGENVHQKQSRNKTTIKIGIVLTEEQGYTEFTASVLRRYHEINGHDVNVYTKHAIGHTHTQLAQWYGENITITYLGEVFPMRTILLEFVDQSEYETLFLIDSNMVFLPSWKDFIITHMINKTKQVHFLSLYHAASMHSFANDCENFVEYDLCAGSLQSKLGVAISKHFAGIILLKHLQSLQQYNWVEISRKENFPLLYPRKSLIINIKQTNQSEDYCGENAVPYGFNLCELPVWIRDGLEWYMDRCTNAQEKYLPGISIEQANRENRSWTRPAISYALFGNSTKYTGGALANSKRVYSIYPGWKIWVYLDDSVPKKVVEGLCEQNVKFVNMTGTDVINKMSWRFLIATEPVQMYAIRDSDSKLLSRGKTAVDEWIKSGRKFHVMRDHPNHAKHPINGGMWGGRVAIPDMKSLIKRYRGGNAYMTDMKFLRSVIWEIVSKSVWAHDSHSLHLFGEDHPFATPWNQRLFVGKRDFW